MSDFLKVEEVAEVLQVSPRQVINLCKSENSPLPHVKINGRSLRFQRSAIDKWFEKNTIAAISM